MLRSVRSLACAAAALMLLGAGSARGEDEGASRRDLERLQDALANLDDGLGAVDPEHERFGEFLDRAEGIREEVIWLKVELRRVRRDRDAAGPSRDDIEDIRVSIVDLQRDIDDALDRRLADEVTLREGTEIQVRLEQPLSSATARREDRVEATVAVPVRSGRRVVIPAGSRVRGVVRDAEPAQRPARAGRLDLSFDSIYVDDRERTSLRTRVVSVKEDVETGQTARKAGIGAAIGGVLGGILGGRKGAVIGIVVGGTGGVVASQGEDVELPAGAILTLRLDRPLTVRAPDDRRPERR